MRVLVTALLLSAALLGQTVPRPVRDFPISLTNGQKVSPVQNRGKVVIVEILLTTCPHCQNTSRVLTKLGKEYAGKGVVIMGAAVNPDPDIAAFQKLTGATFPIGTVPRESVYGFLEQSVMRPNLMMPQLVLVDRAGQVRAQFAGNDPFFKNEEANLRALLDKLTSEGGGKASVTSTKKKAS